jgi:hypothetical protein
MGGGTARRIKEREADGRGAQETVRCSDVVFVVACDLPGVVDAEEVSDEAARKIKRGKGAGGSAPVDESPQ